AAEAEFLAEVARRAPAPMARASTTGGPVRPELFPPCIQHMRRMLQDGENLAHSGRFALAAFLHRVGADAETIVDAYRRAPDFDEGITRYRVEPITRRADARGYEPPVCATLRSHGLCFRDGDPGGHTAESRAKDSRCFEASLLRPMQYYRRRGGQPPDYGAPG